MTASIVVVSKRKGEFRVQCTSTGGRALSMTVTGPDGYRSNLTNNIQPVGTLEYIGSNRYTATTSDIITGGNDGDMYQCTVTGSTSNTNSVELRGLDHTLYLCSVNNHSIFYSVANAPTITSLLQTGPGTLRMERSPPVGGASVTEYKVHYNSSSRATTDTTSYDITGLSNSETYIISVEAKSLHLSGESDPWTIKLGKCFDNDIFWLCSLTEPHIPLGVVVKLHTKTTSVSVSWNAVNNADRYTVTFTRATGDEQQGTCPPSTHTASVTVDAPSTTASIDIGQDVESSVTNMLRAYSTYFITVVAENDVNGLSKERIRKYILTMQSMFNALHQYYVLATLPFYIQVLLYLLIMSWLQI